MTWQQQQQPGVKPVSPAVEVQSPNHWTARDFPVLLGFFVVVVSVVVIIIMDFLRTFSFVLG